MSFVIHLTKAQLAERWSVTTRTIENMMCRGDIPAPIRMGYKTVRWDLADIEKWEAKKK
jgi:predicted DNA-binding transcriptional regulator AlpA